MIDSEILDVKALLSKGSDNDMEVDNDDDNGDVPVVEVDIGNLIGFCYQEQPQGTSLDVWQQKCFQSVINDLFSLPVTKSINGYLAQLPDTTTQVPREKPYPKEKSDTKWEKFRKNKGMKKKKKDTKVWDERTQTWKFQFGFKRANDDKLDWIIEDKPEQLLAAGAEDPFIMRQNKRKENVSKQKKREKSNQYRVQNKDNKKKLPGIMGITNKGRHDKVDIERAISFAQKSNASIGNFGHKFDDEPKIKRPQKRQSVTGNSKNEKKKPI
jgi:regulator of ribosome biosynthesis